MYSIERTPLSYLITFTAEDVAVALGQGRDVAVTSHFCKSTSGSCTLGVSETDSLVRSVDRLIRRHRGALASCMDRHIVENVKSLFWLFYDAIEASLDLTNDECVCSWDRRMDHAERLTDFLIQVARVYWSTRADRDWMSSEIEGLACRANEVAERNGSIARRDRNDPSVEARADRLSTRLFDTTNDFSCDNWRNEAWMSLVPTG